MIANRAKIIIYYHPRFIHISLLFSYFIIIHFISSILSKYLFYYHDNISYSHYSLDILFYHFYQDIFSFLKIIQIILNFYIFLMAQRQTAGAAEEKSRRSRKATWTWPLSSPIWRVVVSSLSPTVCRHISDRRVLRSHIS